MVLSVSFEGGNRAGLSDPNRPIASFMFLGPTGGVMVVYRRVLKIVVGAMGKCWKGTAGQSCVTPTGPPPASCSEEPLGNFEAGMIGFMSER